MSSYDLRLYVAGQTPKAVPTPIKKIVGDLPNAERVLVGLDLRPRRANAA